MKVSLIIFTFSFITPLASWADNALNICVINPITDKKILPNINNYEWGSLGCQSEMNIFAAKGEYEPGSLVVRAKRDIDDIEIKVSDFIKGDHVIHSDNVEIKYVKAWYQANTAWKGIRKTDNKRFLVPELLLNDDELLKIDYKNKINYAKISTNDEIKYIDISKLENLKIRSQPKVHEFPIRDSASLRPINIESNSAKQIWFTIYVPHEAFAGKYTGKIIVSYNDVEIKIPVSLTVYPFKLDQPLLKYSLYYRGVLASNGENTISSEVKSEAQMRLEFIDMLEHGVTNPTIYQPHSDLNKFERVLKLRQESGVSNHTIYYLGMNTGNYTDKSSLHYRYETLKKIMIISKKYGAENVYIYGIDEADVNDFKGQYPVWEKIHELGGKIFGAAWRKDRVPYIAGKMDLLINGITPDLNENNIYKNSGTSVYLYNRPQVGVENPEIYRMHYGYLAWQNGFNGVMDYAYQDGFGFIWNDFDHYKFRDHVFAYPTANGVINTIAWEGFREAVDDVKYLTTLINLLSSVNGTSEDPDVIDARRYIEKLRHKNILDYNETRQEIASYIINLCCNDKSLRLSDKIGNITHISDSLK